MPIYMFHYVKPNSNYHYFKLDEFERFVSKNKNRIISLTEYLNNKNTDKIVLTFDDGTIDHYNYIFPILKKYSVVGVFSVCDNIRRKKVLNIQKIHYLIDKIGVDDLYIHLFSKLNKKYFDSNNVTKEAIIKELLQFKLPFLKRENIIRSLLKKYNLNLKFKDVYITMNMIKEMQYFNNEFLFHTRDHFRLDKLTYNQQLKQIKSIKTYIKKYNFLKILTVPFGCYNEDTLSIIYQLNIDKVLSINYNNNERIISRVDCNILKEN